MQQISPILTTVIFLGWGCVCFSQTLQLDYQATIGYYEGSIQLDGRLEEPVWQQAAVAKDFWMSFPVDDRRVAEDIQTEVWMCYDDQYLYVAARCHGKGPYVIQSLKRDNPLFWQGDGFAVVLDPVNEQSSGFVFGTNPASVQTESLLTGQTGRRGTQSSSGINGAWDNKWFCQSAEETNAWTLEMAIPFKSLRFAEKDRWGLNFIRSDAATNSYHTWSPVPVQFRGVDLGYTGALLWDKPPAKTPGNISLIPYTSFASSKDFEEGTPTSTSVGVGGDAKVAITTSLNLDVTINPDFSQVEVDEQVTNLTTVNVRFPERRLFFLENSDVFSDFGIPPMRPFFSRRIGLDDDGNTIPINFGARLSGNINKDLRIGAMNMHTREQDEHPGQNYTVLAFHQRVLSRSTVKGYFHNRTAYADGNFLADDFNRNAGLEFEYRSADGRWRSFAGYGKSFTDEFNDQNYFYNLGIGYEGRHISAYSNLAGTGNRYVADIGFLPRMEHYDANRDTTFILGFDHWFSRFSYTFYPTGGKVNAHVLGFRSILDITVDNRLIGHELEGSYELRLSNSSSLVLSYNHQEVNLLFPFAFTEEEPLPRGQYGFDAFGVSYSSDQRRKLTFQSGIQTGTFYNGRRTQYLLMFNYRAQPWGNFGANMVKNDLRFPGPFGSEDLLLFGPRIEFGFSTNLFWTTFLQYNTQEDNFNINSRLQWRFQPLSDLFIVYTDNYAVEYWGPKNRAIVVKLSYWLNV